MKLVRVGSKNAVEIRLRMSSWTRGLQTLQPYIPVKMSFIGGLNGQLGF